MQTKGKIQFCYRKIIDSSSQKNWERLVFDSCYTELRMQAQFYNAEKKYKSFAELILNVSGAERLHFLVRPAITGYVQQLNSVIPDILDNLGRHFLLFADYHFEIINADLDKKESLVFAINFFSEEMIWHDTIDKYMLISKNEKVTTADEISTHLVELIPFLGIHSIKIEEV